MTNNKQQTAVEWLEKICNDRGYYLMSEYFEQAKEMEKEQIEEAFANGVDDEYEWYINNVPRKNSETYYNETYGGDE
jgi:predicted RNA-binding protein YlxR (DUF448 family)